MAFDFNFRSSDLSFSYGNRPFYDFFSFGSLEEVIMFLTVFLIGFAVSYTGLKKFFSEKKPAGYYQNKEGNSIHKGPHTVIKNQGAILVISIGIALMMTFGILRSGWLFHYFGDIAGIVGLFIVFALFAIIMFAIFEFLEKTLGTLFGAVVSISLMWGAIKVGLMNFNLTNIPLKILEGLKIISSVGFLIVAIIIGVVLAYIKPRGKKIFKP